MSDEINSTTLALFERWSHVDPLSVIQAAYLWAGLEPAGYDWRIPLEHRYAVAPFLQMLTSAIMIGELRADARHNPLADIGTHNTSMVRRADLISFAVGRGQRPPFLFTKTSTSASGDATKYPKGRVRQAPPPPVTVRRKSGAKQTKLEMVKERIAIDYPNGVPAGVKNAALADKYGVHERTVRRAMGRK
jgi:hypothetical protein